MTQQQFFEQLLWWWFGTSSTPITGFVDTGRSIGTELRARTPGTPITAREGFGA